MQKYFFIKEKGRYLKIPFSEIVFVEGCGNYIKIVTENKAYLLLIAMKRMEQLLPAFLFKRIHRSYIVSLDKITGFDSDCVYLKDKELPIGQLYKGELEKAVIIINDTATEEFSVNQVYKMPFVMNTNFGNRI
jgi:DNA-binding LytR/AlgR family response regulator